MFEQVESMLLLRKQQLLSNVKNALEVLTQSCS